MKSISKSYKYDKLISYLFYLLPAMLVTGPFLSNLAVSIIAIYFIFVSFNNSLWHYYKNWFTIIFLIFYIYILGNSLLSSYPTHSLESSLFYFRFLLFSLCCFYFIKTDNNFIKKFTYCTIITILIVVIDGFIQYFLGTNSLGFDYSGTRVSGFFGNELILGSYLSRLFPLVLALVIFSDISRKYKLLVSAVLFILIDLLVFLSGERTAFFYTTLTCVMLLVFSNDYKVTRLITLIISIALLSIVTLNYSSVKERMVDKTILQMGLEENKKSYIFSWKHHNIYINSFQMFQDSPIFGHGPKSYRKVCTQKEYEQIHCATHSHNTYLQLLAETGIVGFIIVFSLFLYLTYKLLEKLLFMFKNSDNKKISDYQMCLIISMYISLWPFAPSMNFFSSWISIIYFLPVGFYLASTINLLDSK